jgi:RNA polymerase sigma factor (sigma-70 family)
MLFMLPSDAELVAHAQCGNAEALGLLLERHRAGVTAVAVGLVGHGPNVEDVVHETFLVALTAIDKVRNPDSAGPWLMGITRNLCLQRLRRAREVPFGTLESVYREKDHAQSFELIDRLAVRDWVWSALDLLTEPLRLAVILRHFSRANSYRDIAAICGVPLGTVRSRLSQARAKLAEALRDQAARADGDHFALTTIRRRQFEEAYAGYNCGEGDLYLAPLDADVEVRAWGETVHGLDAMVEAVAEDMTAGVKLHVENLVASRSITVLEGTFENPMHDPEHCPPATTQVYLHDGDGIRAIRLHFPSAR